MITARMCTGFIGSCLWNVISHCFNGEVKIGYWVIALLMMSDVVHEKVVCCCFQCLCLLVFLFEDKCNLFLFFEFFLYELFY